MPNKKQNKQEVPKVKKIKGNNIDLVKENKDNPLLKVKDNSEFIVETKNILNDVTTLLFPGFENFDIHSGNIDVERLNNKSEIIVIALYFEYFVSASFNYEYILPLLESGLGGSEIFKMIEHHLMGKMIMSIPSFCNFTEFDIEYKQKIKY